MIENINKSDKLYLRQKAEDLLMLKKSKSDFNLTETDALRLIHELEVHQIELEMQNEELNSARERALKSEEKYTELFDFAPIAYYLISKAGEILDLNLFAAKILGKERIYLKNQKFTNYLSAEMCTVFYTFLDNIFKYKNQENCEIEILTNTEFSKYVYLTGIVSNKNDHCLVALTDITERILVERELIKKSKKLQDLNHYFIDREMKMIDLKKEINELLIKSGKEKKY
ncbi:MAG: PAS domain S-box protein [Bacteroidales bacterium]